MRFSFRTKIFLAIALILVGALTTMFLASSRSIRQPLEYHVIHEIERYIGNLELLQRERIRLLQLQGKLLTLDQSIWFAMHTLRADLSNDYFIDPSVPDEERSEEAIRLSMIHTIRDSVLSSLERHGDPRPDFLLALDTEGEIIYSYGEGPSAGENAQQYTFWGLREQNDAGYTPFLLNQRLYFTIMEPVELDGQLEGYIALAFAVNSEVLGAFLRQPASSNNEQQRYGLDEVSLVVLSPQCEMLASNAANAEQEQWITGMVDSICETLVQGRSSAVSFEHEGEEIVCVSWPLHGLDEHIVAYEVALTSKTKALAILDQLQFTFLAIMLIALTLSALLGWLVSRGVTKPVDMLARAASQLTAGRLDEPIVYEKKDELGLLANAFEHMRIALLRRINELAELNASLENKVQERTIELQKALDNLKQAESHLVLSEKMVALGQLVAGIAHEINNPINYIRSGIGALTVSVSELKTLLERYDACSLTGDERRQIQRLKEEIEYDALMQEVEELAEAIANGAERTIQIVNNLRSFSYKDTPGYQSFDVHAGLESSLNILQHELRGRIEVVRDYGDLPEIQCNGGQINQVFLNLLNNAQQAIDGQGSITITTQRQEDQVMISIRDTGCGIPEEKMGKIFEPFFTTKDVGKGTGLGLAITYGIIQRHGGRIDVSSEVNAGTEFRLYLPIESKDADLASDSDSGALFDYPRQINPRQIDPRQTDSHQINPRQTDPVEITPGES